MAAPSIPRWDPVNHWTAARAGELRGRRALRRGLQPPAPSVSPGMSDTPFRWRLLALAVLGILALPLYARILAVAGLLTTQADRFTLPELGTLAVAVVAAALVLASRPARTCRQRWTDLTLLLGFGVAFRAVFFAATPAISHDAYRYVWDAHVLANGVSPWVHALSDPALKPLRDSAIWPQVNWRTSPTIYPPGAQLVFLLVNAVAPLNIAAMKWAMTLCDFGVGALTLVLLRQRGQDLRRVIVYWWNPLPIVEFTFNAHVDALATLWTLAALTTLAHNTHNTHNTRRARTISGVLLGLAAATKLYPLLFAAALLRPASPLATPPAHPRRQAFWPQATLRPKRSLLSSEGRAIQARFQPPPLLRLLTDPLLLALGATLILVYLPFTFVGLGNGGFLATYFGQRFLDEGILFRLITSIFVFAPIQLALQGIALVALCGLVAWLRLRRGLEPAAGVLAISAIWIALSPHLFSWYVAGLLPLLALYLHPIPFHYPSSARRGAEEGFSLALYLFVLAMPFTYVIFAPGHNANLFAWFFYVPLAVAASPWIARAITATVRRPRPVPMRVAGSPLPAHSPASASITGGAPTGRPPLPSAPAHHTTTASAYPPHAPALQGRDTPSHTQPGITTHPTALEE